MGSYVIEEMLDWSEDLKTEVLKLENGATVIDCGVKAEGGYEAGMYLAEASAWPILPTSNILLLT